MDGLRRIILSLLAMTLAAVVTSGMAHADRSFDVEHLQLALHRSPFFATEGAGEIPRWDYRVGVVYRYVESPLVIQRPGELREVIATRSTIDVQGAVQFGRWVGLGVSMPVVIADRGSADVAHGAAPGDLRISPRVEILHRGRFGLAAMLGLRAPTGAGDRFVGDGMVVFEPRVAFQVKLGMVELGTNLGVRIREERTFLDLTVGNEIFLTLAMAVTPRPYLSAVLELHGDTALSSAFAERQRSPAEVLAGLFGSWRGLRGGVAAGVGIADGWGNPRTRVLVTFEYRRPEAPRPLPPPSNFPRPPAETKEEPIPEPAPVVEPVPEPVPEPTPTVDGPPIVTREEPAVALHHGRIELAEPIYFEKDRRRVRHHYSSELKQLARVLNRRTELTTIWIEGHADATGPARWNLELSRGRAEAVAQILVAEGVAEERLRPVGFGEARPLVATPRGESNERNRRVHFFTDSIADAPREPSSTPPKGQETP